MSELVDLPRPLQAWRQWLGWFEPQLATALGDLVRRLSELAGPTPSSAGRTMTEPDGLGDLRARGPYERLLASEWLLADVMPEEFLRRAAASEHLFLAPRSRATQVDRRIVAIFDCGPRQLGAPRLAHMAAWILLARRAADLGGTLRWGVLQEPGSLRESATPAHLLQLLAARSLVPDDDALRTRWREALEAEPESVSPSAPAASIEQETWWIGARPEQRVARLDRHLALRSAWEPGELEVALATPGATRRARLPLPPDALATALLRGQLSTAAARPAAPRVESAARADEQRLALTRPPLFSPDGGHVAVPSLGGHGVLVFDIQKPGRNRTARRRRQTLSALRSPIAMTLRGLQAQALCVDDKTLYFWQVDGFVPRARPPLGTFDAAAAGARLLPMAVVHDPRHGKQVVFVADRRGRLCRWSDNGAPPEQVDDKVLAITALGTTSLAYAVEHGGGLWVRATTAAGPSTPLQKRLGIVEERFAPVLLATSSQGSAASVLAAAAIRRRRSPAAVWRLMTAAVASKGLLADVEPDACEIELRPGDRVAGLLPPRGAAPAALVVLSVDGRSVHLEDGQQRTLLYRSDEHVLLQCAVNAWPPRVALITQARELVVLDATTAPAQPLLVVSDTVEVAR